MNRAAKNYCSKGYHPPTTGSGTSRGWKLWVAEYGRRDPQHPAFGWTVCQIRCTNCDAVLRRDKDASDSDFPLITPRLPPT